MRPLAVIALLGSGCSFALVDAPPDGRAAAVTSPEYPRCDEGTGPVIADVVLSALGGIAAIAAAGEDRPDHDTTAFAVFYGLGGLLYGLSAWYGIHATRGCSAARRAWEQRHADTVPVKLRPRVPPPRPPPESGQPGGACFGNRTCNPGLACDPTGHCVAGTVGLEGMTCFADGSCSGDLTCSLGRCVPPPRPECSTDAHCPPGQICRAGSCLLPPTPP